MSDNPVLPAERVSTHWADCWRAHLPCAVARVERLARVVRIQRQELLTIAGAGAGRVSELAMKALKECQREL